MMAEASFPIERNHSESLTHLLLRPSSEHGTAHDSPSTNHGDAESPGMSDGHGTISCMGAAFMIVSIILGLGVLGIPWALSTLGWCLGFFLLFTSAGGSIYSGFLIARVTKAAAKVLRIHPQKYKDLGFAAYGVAGSRTVRTAQYAFLGGAIVAVQMTASKSLRQVVGALGHDLCLVDCNAIIAVAMLPVMQLQTLSDVTWVALLGVITIIIPLGIYMSQLPRQKSSGNTYHVPAESSMIDVASAATTMFFAYQGQTIFPEIISEMKTPSEFPAAVVGGTALMTLAYVIVGTMGYNQLGSSAEYLMKWDNDNNGSETRTIVANIFLIVHVLTGYTINGNVMNQAIAVAVVGTAKGPSTRFPRAAWLCVTLCTLCVSFVLSNLIPTLGFLIAVLGATCGTMLTFIIPVACALKLLPHDMSPREYKSHCIVLGLSVAVLLVGSYATIFKLAKGIADGPPAFSCSVSKT
eukprot:m.192974 g.192974  ORF g.192974 m.192974 type:complete len:466 (-) comp18612_c0_seq17:339-1736(-)